jgi:phage tail sheath protein FI
VQNPPAAAQNANLRGVFFRTASDTAWAVGEGGVILTTADNGQTWTVQNPPQNQPAVTTANLQGVHFLDVDNGLVVGDSGIILRTTNGGQAWTVQNPPAAAQNANLRGVIFRSNTLGWAVGDNGTILKTTDGGQAWTTQDSDVTDHFYGVHFFNNDSGWAVGDNGAILFTEDGGDAWSVQQAVTDESAQELKLTASTGSQNVKAYTMGVGKGLGAQSGATSGQDGLPPRAADFQGREDKKSGIHALLDVDLFNILCLPGVTDFELNDAIAVLSAAVPFCERRRAFCVIDCPESWTTFDDALDGLADFNSVRSKNAAMYFPRVEMPDPLDDNRLRTFPPSGIIAGIYARTDATRGVWIAPAGQATSLTGVRSLVYKLTDRENGLLNPLGLNCLRVFPVVGPVNWGARTLHGADVLSSEWKYIPVRRLALFLEESLYRGTQWVVFEPNDEPLWAQIRLNVGAFMHNLFRQGAFQGTSPRDAYFVKCDKETTTQNDINLGIVNILVGFAPLKPAEFVIIKIQQMAGQVQM